MTVINNSLLRESRMWVFTIQPLKLVDLQRKGRFLLCCPSECQDETVGTGLVDESE